MNEARPDYINPPELLKHPTRKELLEILRSREKDLHTFHAPLDISNLAIMTRLIEIEKRLIRLEEEYLSQRSLRESLLP